MSKIKQMICNWIMFFLTTIFFKVWELYKGNYYSALHSVMVDLWSGNLRFNFGNEKLMEIIIQHYATKHNVLHKFKDVSELKHSIPSLILSALVLEIIHSSSCIWMWKSATVYFEKMLNGHHMMHCNVLPTEAL